MNEILVGFDSEIEQRDTDVFFCGDVIEQALEDLPEVRRIDGEAMRDQAAHECDPLLLWSS